MIKVFIFDRRYRSNTPPDIAFIETDYLLNTFSVERVFNRDEASHCIVHYESDDINALENFDSVSNELSCEYQIFLCLTTQISGYDKKIHVSKMQSCENYKRYILYANNTTEVKQAKTLTAFYQMSNVEAEAIINRQFNEIPFELLHLFGLNRGCLSALSILCQGYLAVRASVDNSFTSPVTEALRLMNWDNSQHESIVSENLHRKQQRVQEVNWWLKIFNEQSSHKSVAEQVDEIEVELKREWNSGIHEFSPVANLLNDLKTGTIKPDLVANAYIAIANKLNED